MSQPFLTSRFDQALQLAHQWHARQVRKGSGVPYIAHLLGVASIALEFGAGEDEAIAALLHDALEDGPSNLNRDASDLKRELEASFGTHVLHLIQGCTDAEPQAGQAKEPWAERKRAYLQRLRQKEASTLLVSGSDKLYNARAILVDLLTHGEAVFERFTAGRGGTLWYYRALSDAYRKRVAEIQAGPELQALVAELERTVSVLERETGTTAEENRAFPVAIPEAQ